MISTTVLNDNQHNHIHSSLSSYTVMMKDSMPQANRDMKGGSVGQPLVTYLGTCSNALISLD